MGEYYCKYCGSTNDKICLSRYIGWCHKFEEMNREEARLKRQLDVRKQEKLK